MALPALPHGRPDRYAPPNPETSWSSQFLRGFARGLSALRFRQLAHELNDAYTSVIHNIEQARVLLARAPANEPFRGPRRVARRGDRRSLGQIKAEEARSRARARTRPPGGFRPRGEASRSILNLPGIRARVGGPFAGGAVLAAGNEIIQITLEVGRLQKESRARGTSKLRTSRSGQYIRTVGRRGAAATRALPTRSATNRTGAGAQLPSPVSPSPVPGVPIPQRSPARDPGRSGGTLRSVSRDTGAVNAPVAGRAPAPRSTTGHAPDYLRVQFPDTADLLMRALSPRAAPARAAATAARAAARVVSPLPTTLGTPFSPAPAARVLTPSNSPLLGFSQLTEQEPVPQEATDRCKCPKERKRESKKRCRNPVVSRTRSGDIQTTKVRLICPQSRPK